MLLWMLESALSLLGSSGSFMAIIEFVIFIMCASFLSCFNVAASPVIGSLSCKEIAILMNKNILSQFKRILHLTVADMFVHI